MESEKFIARSIAQRLATEKKQLEQQLAAHPVGSAERAAVLKKLHQIQTATSVDGWLSSPGLRPQT